MSGIYEAPWGIPPQKYDDVLEDQPIGLRIYSDGVTLIQAEEDTTNYICVGRGEQLDSLITRLTDLQKEKK